MYEINTFSIELSKKFYDQFIKELTLIRIWNKIYKTNKIEAFLKRIIIEHIYEVLLELYYLEPYLKEMTIVSSPSILDEFIINAFVEKARTSYKYKKFTLRLTYYLTPIIYYATFIIKTFRNGVCWQNKKTTKYFSEASNGIFNTTLRDDFFIDGLKIKKKDVVFYQCLPGEQRKKAYQEVKAYGYNTVNIHNLKLNLKNNIISYIKNYFIYPFILFFYSLPLRYSFMTNYVLTFYLNSYPFYVFLTNYKSKCHVSSNDHGEIAETIIMNKFGCINILYHWADMTVARLAILAYLSHNILFEWGPIHYEFMKDEYYFNEVKEVGCMFRPTNMNLICSNKQNTSKSVLLCDNSFAPHIHYTEYFYIQFLGVLLKMLIEFKEINFILKPKNDFNNLDILFTDQVIRSQFIVLSKKLKSFDNLTIYNHKTVVEELFSSVDLVINMGFNTPATIALLAGKEAIYYDRTNNTQHPFSKFENLLVYRDDDSLLNGIKKILDGKLSVHTEEVDELLKSYDSFRDDKTRERLSYALLQEISNNPITK